MCPAMPEPMNYITLLGEHRQNSVLQNSVLDWEKAGSEV